MSSNGRKRAKTSKDVSDTFKNNSSFNGLLFSPSDQDNSLFASIDRNPHMIQFPTDDTEQFMFLDEEIDKALQISIDPVVANDDSGINIKRSGTPFNSSSNTSPHTSPFECYMKQESITSGEEENENNKEKPQETTKTFASGVCAETVATLKNSLASHSRLIGTFTTLKTTYLKLCKEFNFLLGKFNENERIKIELIHENNELRKLLWETIKDREMDRKEYKAQLAQLGH